MKLHSSYKLYIPADEAGWLGQVRRAADAAGVGSSTYIREAVAQRMQREGEYRHHRITVALPAARKRT